MGWFNVQTAVNTAGSSILVVICIYYIYSINLIYFDSFQSSGQTLFEKEEKALLYFLSNYICHLFSVIYICPIKWKLLLVKCDEGA